MESQRWEIFTLAIVIDVIKTVDSLQMFGKQIAVQTARTFHARVFVAHKDKRLPGWEGV